MASFFPRFLKGGSEREMDRLSGRIDTTSSRDHQSPAATIVAPKRFGGPSDESIQKKPSDLTKLEDLELRLQHKETEMSQLSQRHERLLQSYRQATDEKQQWMTWAIHHEKERESLWQKHCTLGQELQACKDDLFKMQPTVKIPDSEIVQAYGELHEHISSWIEGEMSRFEANFDRNHGPVPDFFSHGGSTAVKRFLSANSAFGGEYLVYSVIQTMLHTMVFADEILLHGLDGPSTALLQEIEHGMSKTKPPRDAEAIAMWRSDTLSALTTMSNIQQSRLKSYEEILDAMFDSIARCFPIVKQTTTESMDTLFDKVLSPAVKLASTIQLSPTKYEFFPDMEVRLSTADDVLLQEDLSHAQLIDVGTRKTLKVDSAVQANERGEIGHRVMMLAPALYRRGEGDASLLLVKEMGLVKLHKPLGRRRAATLRQELPNKSSLI